MLRSGGFTVVESLMALIMVSAVLMLMAPALFHVANERVTVDAATRREALLRGESNRIASLPFANLDAQAGCASVSTPHLPHQRCITVTTLSVQERTLVVKITPTNTLVPRDSVVITRTDRKANPFNTNQP
jgi:hypothetical protein